MEYKKKKMNVELICPVCKKMHLECELVENFRTYGLMRCKSCLKINNEKNMDTNQRDINNQILKLKKLTDELISINTSKLFVIEQVSFYIYENFTLKN